MGVTGVMLLSRYVSHVVPKTTFTASNRMTQQSKRRLVCVCLPCSPRPELCSRHVSKFYTPRGFAESSRRKSRNQVFQEIKRWPASSDGAAHLEFWSMEGSWFCRIKFICECRERQVSRHVAVGVIPSSAHMAWCMDATASPAVRRPVPVTYQLSRSKRELSLSIR